MLDWWPATIVSMVQGSVVWCLDRGMDTTRFGEFGDDDVFLEVKLC